MSNPASRGEKGFTLPEVLIASSIAGLAFALSAVAVMGFRFSTQTSFTQLQTRLRNHNALEKMGRQVMESTKVTVQGGQEEHQILHLWHDDQVVWTPETTEDDTEGILYLDYETHEVRYRSNIAYGSAEDLVATQIDDAHFEVTGNALFITLDMTYDPHTPGAERQILTSFVVRNNPKARIGASQ
jgi:prepilin-type N-terminal cleavage/methylation domain-containing protein